MAKPKHQGQKLISNRRARFDYDIKKTYTVGLQLSGAETKSLRQGNGQLTGAYVNISKDELWLINSTISGSPGINISELDQSRTRKLLAKKSEILELKKAKEQGLTIVPLEILTAKRYIKLNIASAAGKKRYDKRSTIKKREETRKINRLVKR